MPIVATAHISLRSFIFNHSDEKYSGGLVEYLAMKMMNIIGKLSIHEEARFLSGWKETLSTLVDKDADASSKPPRHTALM